MKLTAIFLLCFKLSLFLASAQQRSALAPMRRADSLSQVLRVQPRPDTTRVRRLLALSQELMSADVTKATDLGRQALQLAQQLHDDAGQGLALLNLSKLERRQAHYEPARRYAQQARHSFARRRNPGGLSKAWLQLSYIDMVQNNPAPALAAALKGLPLAEQARDLPTQTRLKATIGTIYMQMGNGNEAVPALLSALKSGQRIGDQQSVMQALAGLGNTYQMLKQWPQALAYYQRALEQSRQLRDLVGETESETNLAAVYGEQGSHEQAMAHGLRARQLARATHDEYNLPSVELMLARQYLLLGRTDSSLALARHGLLLSQQSRSNENIRNACDILAETYARRGNYAQAYRYRNQHLAYNDTLAGEDTRRRTSALLHDYELQKKQAQINLLTKTRQLQAQKAARQRLQLYGLLAGLAGVALVAALLLRNIFLKQRTNRHLNEKNQQIAAHRDDLDRTLTELQAAQARLVQHEKMASLGALTAGVAHEMQNPLNFITNFSDLSVELVAELEEELRKEALSGSNRQYINELLLELTQNQTKIWQHGQRADRIVKRMLEHSEPSTGQRQPTDLSSLAGEHLRLAYQSWCAKNKDFQALLTTDFEPNLPPALTVPQELSRVLFNVLANAFYTLTEKIKLADATYQPEVHVQTCLVDEHILIRVRDNGNGIPAALHNKIFQPFFTTKPTGEGTGLGLSLSYDIITQGHGGTLSVESREGEFTEFTISLPVEPPAPAIAAARQLTENLP